MARMEVPTGPSLNTKYSLKAAERNSEWGDYGIRPIDDTRNAACRLVHVYVILQEVVVLESRGIVGPEETWKLLSHLVQLGLQLFRQALGDLVKDVIILVK